MSVDGFCIGIDVGGTFTDAVLSDADGLRRAKVPTTPDDVGVGVLDACEAVAARAGRPLDEVLGATVRFGLGTTVVTNLLATRNGKRVGLLTTRGFEDLVPIARGALSSDGGWLSAPAPLASRACIVGLDERVDRHGTVVRALDPAAVAAAGRVLVDEHGVEAIAVSLLWSFRNPTHEAAAVRLLQEQHPGLPITSGAQLHPAIREYERTMTALLNAYVAGALEPVERTAATLRHRGLTVPVLLIHSNGGTTTLEEANANPAGLVGSGPAAGVAAACALEPHGDLITCDMGGTSLDIGLVHDGSPSRTSRGPLMGLWAALSRVEIESIGAGGGSVAWIDARGMLRVGPDSAGATPGPACYGRGGSDATITDACVVLGYLDPDRFLDGTQPLDADAARAACAALGAPLGLDADELAWGIRRVALAGMTKAVRRELATRGLDPRRQTLVSYGGCGGLFACDLARAVGASRVLVPHPAAVLSALGAASADVRRERVRSVAQLVPVPVEPLATLACDLTTQLDTDLAADGIEPPDRRVDLEADLRFKRQTFELSVPLERIDDDTNEVLVAAFRSRYAARYGEAAMMRGAPIELVTLRAVGLGRTRAANHREAPSAEPNAAPPAHLRVRVGRARTDELAVPAIASRGLEPDQVLRGPVIVDGGDTSVWLPPGSTARVGLDRALLIEVGP